MVKFHSETDRQLFLLEVGKGINEEDTPDDHRLFVQRRDKIGSMFQNFRKSREGELNWVRNRFNMMRGINKFTSSPEGMRFHRQLGRWLSTRIFVPKQGLFATAEEKLELRKLRDELIEEREYYHSLETQVFLDELIEQISSTF